MPLINLGVYIMMALLLGGVVAQVLAHMSDSTSGEGLRIGDRVRITSPDSSLHHREGVIRRLPNYLDHPVVHVELENHLGKMSGRRYVFRVEEVMVVTERRE